MEVLFLYELDLQTLHLHTLLTKSKATESGQFSFKISRLLIIFEFFEKK